MDGRRTAGGNLARQFEGIRTFNDGVAEHKRETDRMVAKDMAGTGTHWGQGR